MAHQLESPACTDADRHSQCSRASHQHTFFDEFDGTTDVSTSPDECQIVLTYRRVRFALIMRSCESSTRDHDAIDELLAKLEEAEDDPDEMLCHDVIAEIQRIGISTSEVLIRSLAASVSVSQQESEHLTLESHLYPPTFVIQLTADQGMFKATEMENSEEYIERLQPCAISGDFSGEVKILPASDLDFIQDLYVGLVFRVSQNGKSCILKRAHHGNQEQITREIQTLQQISELQQQGLMSGIAIPQFIGLVTSHGQVIGFLEEFVEGDQLSEFDLDSIPTTQRRIWRRRIEETISLLHKHGIVWGDVKPENVLIHDDRPWLIDFGGSWTEGWVDEELAETVEGDLQGLQRLVQFLGLRQ